MDQATFERKAELLRADTQDVSQATLDNVENCIGDAIICLVAACQGEPFPFEEPDSAAAWEQAANRWLERAAQHRWGFERPTSW